MFFIMGCFRVFSMGVLSCVLYLGTLSRMLYFWMFSCVFLYLRTILCIFYCQGTLLCVLYLWTLSCVLYLEVLSQYNLSNPACYQIEKKIRIIQVTGIERLTYPRDIKVTLVSIAIEHMVDNGYINELYTQIYFRLKLLLL